jgi:hypothetical protein
MPLVGPDGTQLLGEDGKRRYAKVISFETPAARTRWNDGNRCGGITYKFCARVEMMSSVAD